MDTYLRVSTLLWKTQDFSAHRPANMRMITSLLLYWQQPVKHGHLCLPFRGCLWAKLPVVVASQYFWCRCREFGLQPTLCITDRRWPDSSPAVRVSLLSVTLQSVSQSVSQFVSCQFSLFSVSSSLWSEEKLWYSRVLYWVLNTHPEFFTRLNLAGSLLLDCLHTSQDPRHAPTHWHDMLEQEQLKWNGCSTLAYAKSQSHKKPLRRPCGICVCVYLSKRHSETPTPKNQSNNQ